ncbi:MAG: flagellar hook capping FlgD N-terminal domain-containing protein [Planctomycetota bacterium]
MASVSSIGSVGSGVPLKAADLAAPKPTAEAGKMSKNDFMTLLMAQMKNQNPMDPQSASDFATQLAQFSSLEGINQMNQNFSSLLTLQGLSQGTNLIGKSVSYAADAAGHTATGVVQSVGVVSGEVQVVIGGTNVPISKLTGIGGAQAA